VSALSDAYQSWRHFYEITTQSTTDAQYNPLLLYNSSQIKALQRILTLLAKVSTLDSTLAEEISRAGSQSILSRLLEQIKLCVSIAENCEEDFDTLMDLQDTACEVYVPSRGVAFTEEELIARLPLVYDLRPAAHKADGEGESVIVLINQVTKRQSAQVDVGFLMWPSAIVLSRYILSNTHLIKNKTILEIGAGCGLVGIVAASIVKDCVEPSRVVITDVNNTVLNNIERNISLNNVGEVASVAKLDFYRQTGDNHEGQWVSGEYNGKCEMIRSPVVVILAADIICQPEDAIAAAKTIYDALIPGGVAYVVCANEKHRFGVSKFEGACNDLNLCVTVTNVRDMYDGNLLTECMETSSGFVDGMTLLFFEVKKHKQQHDICST
jgi:predicted nicotinamide N-methyase